MGTFRNFVSSSVLGGTLYRIHRCSITIVTNIIPSKIFALGKCPSINRQCTAQTSVNSARVFTSQSCVASLHKYSALKRRSIHLFHFSSCRKSNLLLNDWFMMTLPVLRGTLASRMASSGSKGGDSYYRRTALIYICAVGIFMLGMSYAGVPLYRMLCQATGLGGTVVRGHDSSKIESMQKVPDRIIRVRFNADVASSMRWNFKPQQAEVKVLPGETALAFYTAKNSTDKPIIGISTYNVVPFEAGQYFNKIQCFCFEEQRLNPHEQVDMPVFFYIDPEFVEDPKLKSVDTITLSYTFFQAKEGLKLPLPGFMTQ